MAIITVTNETPGAPIVTTPTDDYIQNILKFALPLLGWTVEFDDIVNTGKIVFSTTFDNIKRYLQVVPSSHPTLTLELRCYSDMTDVNTGTEGTTTPTYLSMYANNWTVENPGKWTIIGDEKTFIVLSEPSSNITTANYVGGIHTTLPGDSAFIMCGYTLSGTSGDVFVDRIGLSSSLSAASLLHKGIDQTVETTVGLAVNMPPYTSNRALLYFGYDMGGKTYYSPIYVLEANTSNFRGFLRGLLMVPYDSYLYHEHNSTINLLCPNNQEKAFIFKHIDRGTMSGSAADATFLIDLSTDWDWHE